MKSKNNRNIIEYSFKVKNQLNTVFDEIIAL